MQSALSVIVSVHLAHPLTRAAACIWLLSIAKQTSRHPTLLQNLNLLQTAFSLMLSDANEIVQEVASKGLVIIYDLGDDDVKVREREGKKEGVCVVIVLFPITERISRKSGGYFIEWKERSQVEQGRFRSLFYFRFLSFETHFSTILAGFYSFSRRFSRQNSGRFGDEFI
jgi:hypothetical protein